MYRPDATAGAGVCVVVSRLVHSSVCSVLSAAKGVSSAAKGVLSAAAQSLKELGLTGGEAHRLDQYLSKAASQPICCASLW